MTEYVAGFMFEGDRAALIRKKRPAWQLGKLNGIGGHIEDGESPLDAMVREFREETGYDTISLDWKPVAELEGMGFRVHFFYSYGDLSKLKTTTDEEIVIVDVDYLRVCDTIPNLAWLIPMAKSLEFDSSASYFLIQEAA